MGILLLIVPLLIYYVIVVPIIKIKVINEIESKKLKTLVFIVLLLFPIGDHLIGYIVYKTLCFTNGGVTIYKTVTDEQEQRDYWIDSYNQKRAPYTKCERYGINGHIYLTKDLKYHKIAYTNSCESKRWKSYDCKKAIACAKKNNIQIYTYSKNINNLKRSKKNSDYLENSSLKVTRVINEDEHVFEYGYLNYCNPKYNILPKTNPNYKSSCTNADEIIKKYSLKNVIKVPKSPYVYSTHWSRILPLGLTFDTGQVKNYKTKEILGENTEITFWGGWFINLLSPFENRGERFNYLSGSDLQKFIIPNPYKTKNNEVK